MLITTSAPLTSAAQSPTVSPSQETSRQGVLLGAGLRLSTTTSSFRSTKCRARMVPSCPEQPGITTFIWDILAFLCEKRLAIAFCDIDTKVIQWRMHTRPRVSKIYIAYLFTRESSRSLAHIEARLDLH